MLILKYRVAMFQININNRKNWDHNILKNENNRHTYTLTHKKPGECTRIMTYLKLVYTIL